MYLVEAIITVDGQILQVNVTLKVRAWSTNLVEAIVPAY
jgi:hypothetical protein